MKAPEDEGLFMIWFKSAYHYSFQQAATDQWPKDYSQCENWYSNFIAWLVVRKDAAPGEATGRPASLPL